MCPWWAAYENDLGLQFRSSKKFFTHCAFLAGKSVVNGNDVEDGDSVGCGVEVHVVKVR